MILILFILMLYENRDKKIKQSALFVPSFLTDNSNTYDLMLVLDIRHSGDITSEYNYLKNTGTVTLLLDFTSGKV
jgi:hypothetical protein